MNRTESKSIQGTVGGDGRRCAIGAALLLVGLLVAPAVAGAQVVEPRFELRLDYFQAEYDSSVRFDSAKAGLAEFKRAVERAGFKCP